MRSVSPKVRIVPKVGYESGLSVADDDHNAPRSGGQFLRAYIERHNDPPIRNLITFGSQHMGISDLPACKPYDLLCILARNAVRAGVYNEWAQHNLVQVTYLSFLSLGHTEPDLTFVGPSVFSNTHSMDK
jgi:hypothetical protein